MRTEVETVAGSPPLIIPEAPPPVHATRDRQEEDHWIGSIPVALAALALAIFGSVVIVSVSTTLIPKALPGFAHFARTDFLGVIVATAVFGLLYAALLGAIWLLCDWGDKLRPRRGTPADLPPMPPWAVRAAALLLFIAVIGFIRTVWTFCAPEPNGMVSSFDGSVFLALTTIAIGRRSATTRLAAILIQTVLFALIIMTFVVGTRLMLGGEAVHGTPARHPTFFLDLLAIVAWPLSLMTLVHGSVRKAFGIVPKDSEIAARELNAAAESRYSKKAVWGAVLAGYSMLASIPIFLLIAILIPMMQRAHDVINFGGALFLASLGILAVAPPIAGTLLGIVGWREINRLGLECTKANPLRFSQAWPVRLGSLCCC